MMSQHHSRAWHKFEQRLLDLQESLLGVAEIIHQTATVPFDPTAVSQVMDERRDQQLIRVTRALERLDDGDYGKCLQCACDIPLARLEVDPAIEYCRDCAG